MDRGDKREQTMNLPERMENGELPTFAWPGGYPLFYLDNADDVLCPKCANNKQLLLQIVAADINYEDACLYCDHCDERIESAYAEGEVGG